MGNLPLDRAGARLTRLLSVLGLALVHMVLCVNIAVGQESIASTRSRVETLILENNYKEAEAQAQRWLASVEPANDDLAIAEALDALVQIYAGLRRYQDAETIWRRCMDLRVRKLGPKHALVARTIDVMTGIYFEQGRVAEAKTLWRNSLEAYKKSPPVADIERIPNPGTTTEDPLSVLVRNLRRCSGNLKLIQDGHGDLLCCQFRGLAR
ncbi:tetratricopeptide repeat protein [Methylocystis sp.]|uniref:tetratricopeptide repeat protein n=1 Tax=Methylocystis sp. TaxID=1911079 RepID=UPI0025EF8E2E|nr:tetratricopeptide repeat protein [Methylocystis sp.]